ncbi:hypothetical protein JRQ81_003829 [Phrynocephalus forsythii]|uniref:Uncharacterized protein n=1 Tax=Phrynocephalus forsythii TaxID=171643 RepID=A0A9Q0XNT0_9SAUR|nr:hypothetical protein JRQ81_003829 [Phrynocephalus forsythii]
MALLGASALKAHMYLPQDFGPLEACSGCNMLCHVLARAEWAKATVPEIVTLSLPPGKALCPAFRRHGNRREQGPTGQSNKKGQPWRHYSQISPTIEALNKKPSSLEDRTLCPLLL